jgi:hypothetical protein
MRTASFTAQRGGINRQRVRGGARADTLYDLVNGFVTGSRTVVNREGTVRDAVLAANTRGLTAFGGLLHTFSHQKEDYTPVGYLANVLAHPDPESTATLQDIHFAQPFMGALYVVAEWSDGRVAHYWLSSGGEWEADTVYFEGSVVTPTVPNGLLYKAVANNPDAPTQTWQPLKNYIVGDKVLPTTYNGFYYQVTATQGDVPISGAFEPTWEASEGAEVIESADGTGAPAATEAEGAAPQVPPDVRDRYGTGNTQISDASAAAVGLSDSVATWSPGTLYQPGDLVKPRSVSPVINSAIPNANFEDGDTAWSKGTGWVITDSSTGNNGHKPYQGAWYARFTANTAGDTNWKYLEMATKVPVVPGQFVSASCYESRGGGNQNVDGQIIMRWYDQYDVLVKETRGILSNAHDLNYRVRTVQDTTPGGATKLSVGYRARRDDANGVIAVDAFAWDYINLVPVPADFTVYQATQAAAGMSGAEEPTWPGPGNTVVDNEVTWLGGVTSVITWTAVPIMKSDSSEPTWAEQVGTATPDGTISWIASTGYVEEAPQSKVVALAAKKVFAADGDIVRYSATVNPLDWTTAEDAGYLPIGLNTHGANPTEVLALYRGNLLAFNSAGFQMWQVDPDPELMALQDAIPVGSTYQRAAQPVKNDLIFLTELGVRSIGIAGASTNLQAGDIGDPVDPLVEARMRAGAYAPKSIYYPARGQYWLWFGPEVFVLTLNDEGRSWSRYEFPEAVTDATLLDNSLYLRTASHKVWKVTPDALNDDMIVAGGSDGAPFNGVLWWPALDLGNMGVMKQMDSFDLVCKGEVTVQFGYDQRDPTVLTASYTLDGDTLPGTSIPFPMMAPSFAPKLTFSGGQAWEWMSMNLYVQDTRSAGFAG